MFESPIGYILLPVFVLLAGLIILQGKYRPFSEFNRGDVLEWTIDYSIVQKRWGSCYPEHPRVKDVEVDVQGEMILFELYDGKTERMHASNFRKATLM